MKGRHGFNKKGEPIHMAGCVPRALSISFGDKMGYSYADIVSICEEVCARRGEQLDLNRADFYHGLGDRDIYEVARIMGLRFINLINPMPMQYGACLWHDYVAIIKEHAVPYRNCEQIANCDIRPENTKAYHFVGFRDSGMFTL